MLQRTVSLLLVITAKVKDLFLLKGTSVVTTVYGQKGYNPNVIKSRMVACRKTLITIILYIFLNIEQSLVNLIEMFPFGRSTSRPSRCCRRSVLHCFRLVYCNWCVEMAIKTSCA